MELLSLPSEVLYYIFSFLDVRTLLWLEQTCWKLKNIVLDRTLFRIVDISTSNLLDQDLWKLIRKTSCSPSSLFIRKCPRLSGSFFGDCAHLFTTIVRLNLSETALTDTALTFIWEESTKYAKLTHLLFMDCKNVTDDIINCIRSFHPSVETLQITNQLSSQSAVYLVEHTKVLMLSVEDIISILRCQCKLETRSVPCAICQDQGLDHLIPFMSNLKYLMAEETDITSSGIAYLKARLPQLTISY